MVTSADVNRYDYGLFCTRGPFAVQTCSKKLYDDYFEMSWTSVGCDRFFVRYLSVFMEEKPWFLYFVFFRKLHSIGYKLSYLQFTISVQDAISPSQRQRTAINVMLLSSRKESQSVLFNTIQRMLNSMHFSSSAPSAVNRCQWSGSALV